MAAHTSAPFPEFLPKTPAALRHFLYSALQLKDLQGLYREARESGQSPLSDAVLRRLNIEIDVRPEDLQRIPANGPIVVVANHPFGFLDGLILDAILFRTRPDVKILTNSLLCVLEELRDRCLPVDVNGKHKTANVRSVRRSMSWLQAGRGVAIFPAGEVSHWSNRDAAVTDGPWRNLPVRLALSTNAKVVPVFFKGHNSLAFQLAGLIHPGLRTARLPGELFNKRGSKVEVRIGCPISAHELRGKDAEGRAAAYLRARTYLLDHRAKLSAAVPAATPGPGADAPALITNQSTLAQETARLLAQQPIVESGDYAVYAGRGASIPNLVHEIGRQREAAFRAVGEGTGKPADVDRFDRSYLHIILWHRRDAQIAGSYRMTWTDDTLRKEGAGGLYTSTLFRFSDQFFRKLGPAVELGRSFVRLEYQKEPLPLYLLWQAVSRLIAARPEAPTLIGAVSVSAAYPASARELMVHFLKQHCFASEIARLVHPRRPFRGRLLHAGELHLVANCLREFGDLAAPLSDFGGPDNVPVLLRQYLKLGGRVAGFHVDRAFANTLDCLLLVDTRTTDPKLLTRYMGAEAMARFREYWATARAAGTHCA